MSRLHFAAARGARIQADWERVMSGVGGIKPQPTHHIYIHPDDEHLQYGIQSTMLREWAKDDSYIGSVTCVWVKDDSMPGIQLEANMRFVQHSHHKPTDPLHRSLYFLLMAELLADEGL